MYKPLVAYVNRHSQAFGGRWSHLNPLVVYVDRRLQAFGGYFWGLQAFNGRWTLFQAFGGRHGSPFTSLRWQMESFTSLSWHTWIVVYMPLVAHVDRRLQALDCLRGSPFTSLWWQMKSITSLWWLAWIAVCKPLVADGVIYKPLVAYVDRRSQVFGGRWSHLQAFGGIRGSSCTRLLVAYVDRRVEAFGGIC